MKRAAIVVAALFLTLVALRYVPTDRTIVMERPIIQRNVERVFPMGQEFGSAEITYSDPVVDLPAGSDRIGVTFRATMDSDHAQSHQGRIDGVWRIVYGSGLGEVDAVEPKITRLDLPVVAGASQEEAARSARDFLLEYLHRIPIYSLTADQDRPQTRLKSLTVTSEHVVMVVGHE